MSKNKALKITIPPEFERQRLDKALASLLTGREPPLSRARLQALIGQGHVIHSGKAVSDASRKVKSGDTYTVDIPPPEPAEPTAQAMDLKVVYEDKDLLVIDKPAGMVVHPAPGNRDRTLVNALLAHCGKSLSGIGGVMRPGIVHRLDKDTSGLMVVAKNDMAHHALTAQFADRSLSRIYHALVWGVPVPKEGSIKGSIGRNPRDRKKMAVTGKGREALTHYSVVKSFDFASLVECRLETGRTHQIRVHLAYKKYPVVGDRTYGKERCSSPPLEGGVRGGVGSAKAKIRFRGENPPPNLPLKGGGILAPLAETLRAFPRQALHAAELKFIHPRSGKGMQFKSPLPQDMAKLLRGLKTKA